MYIHYTKYFINVKLKKEGCLMAPLFWSLTFYRLIKGLVLPP